MQLEIIRVTLRRESQRLAPVAMADMRARAIRILSDLQAAVAGDDDLQEEIAAVRREIG
jgi:hypothetical protein